MKALLASIALMTTLRSSYALYDEDITQINSKVLTCSEIKELAQERRAVYAKRRFSTTLVVSDPYICHKIKGHVLGERGSSNGASFRAADGLCNTWSCSFSDPHGD